MSLLEGTVLLYDFSSDRCWMCICGMVGIVCAGVKGQAVAGVCYVYTLKVSAAAGHQEAAWQVRVAAGSAGFL